MAEDRIENGNEIELLEKLKTYISAIIWNKHLKYDSGFEEYIIKHIENSLNLKISDHSSEYEEYLEEYKKTPIISPIAHEFPVILWIDDDSVQIPFKDILHKHFMKEINFLTKKPIARLVSIPGNHDVDQVALDTKNRLDKLESRQNIILSEIHAITNAVSMSEELSDIPMIRSIPVRVYLSDADEERIEDIEISIKQVCNAIDFEIVDIFPAKMGSWFKKWSAKSKELLNNDDVKRRLDKLERAAELDLIHVKQSTIDKNSAEGLSSLIAALGDTDNAAIQIGSLLLIKTVDNNGKSKVASRNLTTKELIFIENNQDVLESPALILKRLSNMELKISKDAS